MLDEQTLSAVVPHIHGRYLVINNQKTVNIAIAFKRLTVRPFTVESRDKAVGRE